MRSRRRASWKGLRPAVLGLLLSGASTGCYTGLGLSAEDDPGVGQGTEGVADSDGVDTDGPAPGGDDGGPEPLCGADSTAATRLWRLSDAQHANAVRDLLDLQQVVQVSTPGVTEDAFVHESELLTVTGSMLSQYQSAAEDAALQAADKLAELVPCDPAAGDQACAASFIDEFATRAFRRPLTEDERQELLELHQAGAEDGFAQGIVLVIEAVLQSPSFLYRTELGDPAAASDEGVVELTSYELASALSFFLLDSIPDDELWALAQDDSLSDPEIYREQVERLLALPEVQDNLTRIYLAWLGTAKAATVEKSAELYPEFDEAMRQSMVEQTDLTMAALIQEEGSLSQLLTSTRTFVDANLASLYGVDGVTGDTFVEVELPGQERAGVFTHASVLAMLSAPEETSVVHRGLAIQKLLLCTELPPPPPGVDLDDPDLDGLDQRELAEYRADNPNCSGCHSLIDPYGLVFEHYDPIGRWRDTLDSGEPVDASAQIDPVGEVADAVQMLAALSQDERVSQCVAEQMVTYALGRQLGEADECALEEVHERFVSSEQSLVEPFRAIALSDAFSLRRIEP